jgi:hypothetical protein
MALNFFIAGIALVCVGFTGFAFRLVTTRLAKDNSHDWCQTNRLSWMDNDGWYVFESCVMLIGISLVVAGII